GSGPADGGEEDALTAGHRDVVVAGLVAERPREPAAAGVQELDLEAEPSERAHLRVHAKQRLLMAVAVDEGRAAARGSPGQVRRLALEEVRQQEALRREPPRVVAVDEIRQLVLEDRDAARLEADHGNARLELHGERVEDAAQLAAGEVQHPEVVQRAAAAEPPAGQPDAEARR